MDNGHTFSHTANQTDVSHWWRWWWGWWRWLGAVREAGGGGGCLLTHRSMTAGNTCGKEQRQPTFTSDGMLPFIATTPNRVEGQEQQHCHSLNSLMNGEPAAQPNSLCLLMTITGLSLIECQLNYQLDALAG